MTSAVDECCRGEGEDIGWVRNMHVFLYIYKYITYVYIYAYLLCVCIYTCLCVHVYTHINTYIYVYVDRRTLPSPCSCVRMGIACRRMQTQHCRARMWGSLAAGRHGLVSPAPGMGCNMGSPSIHWHRSLLEKIYIYIVWASHEHTNE